MRIIKYQWKIFRAKNVFLPHSMRSILLIETKTGVFCELLHNLAAKWGFLILGAV
jgi:hypothetical protein